MKRAVALACAAVTLTAALGCSSSKPAATEGAPAIGTSGTADVEATITALEQQWVAAIVAKDTATIDRLLAADFVGTTNDRRYVKQQALDDVREGTHELLRLDDVQVRVYGNTAIADTDQTEKSQHDGVDFSGSYLFTDVWVKQGGEWKAVASHGSRIR